MQLIKVVQGIESFVSQLETLVLQGEPWMDTFGLLKKDDDDEVAMDKLVDFQQYLRQD